MVEMSETGLPEKVPDAVPIAHLRDTFLTGFVGETELKDLTLMTLQSRWPDIVGPISRHSYPAEVRGDRLFVRIEKAVYAQDFNLAIPQILKAIRNLTGAIREVVIQKGRFEPNRPEKIQSESIVEAKPVPSDVTNLLDQFRSGR